MSFLDIGFSTENRAETLTYSDEDAERILESLKDQGTFLTDSRNKTSTRHLEYLLKKEVNCRLHAVTLAEYYKVRRIPRGLRILLKPMLCKDNEGFLVKWRLILNKCSLDLLLLTINELQKNLDIIQVEITETKAKLKPLSTAEDWKKVLDDLNKMIDHHTTELQK